MAQGRGAEKVKFPNLGGEGDWRRNGTTLIADRDGGGGIGELGTWRTAAFGVPGLDEKFQGRVAWLNVS